MASEKSNSANCGPIERSWAVVGILIAIAVITKLPAITSYALGPDELMVWSIAKGGDLKEIFRRNLFEVHPPVEPIIKHVLFFLSENVATLRVIYSLTGIFATFLLALALPIKFRPHGSITLFALLSLSQTFTHCSVLLRGYLFLLLFISLSLYFARRIFEDEKHQTLYLIFLILSVILGGCSHISGFLIAGALLSTILLCRKEITNNAWRHSLLFPILGLAVCGLMTLLVYVFQFQEGSGAAQWRVLAKSEIFYTCAQFYSSEIVIHRLLDIFSIVPSSLQNGDSLAASGLIGFALFIYAIYKCWNSAKWVAVYSITSCSLALCAHLIGLYPLSSPRHMAFLLPSLLMPISIILSKWIRTNRGLKIALMISAAIAVLLTLKHTQFTSHPDFPVTNDSQLRFESVVKEFSASTTPIITSRFGLLYFLLIKDRLKTFYMDSTDNLPLLETAPLRTCVDYYLWQTSVVSLEKCLDADAQFSMSSEVILTSVGFTDNLMSKVRELALKRNSIIRDMSQDGFLLFSLSISELKFLLDGEFGTTQYRENHCTGPIYATPLNEGM